MRPVIQVSRVRKTYGPTVAVDEVSFEVNDGEIFGLIGPNGAGKTTTMECIEGLRTPDRGTITVLGLDPFRQVYQLQERIGVQLQQAQLQKRIKVWEAVDLWASLYRKKAIDGAHLLEQLGLTDKRDTWFMNLSGGQKQRLFIALALINDPELVFLDELTRRPNGCATGSQSSSTDGLSTSTSRRSSSGDTALSAPSFLPRTTRGLKNAFGRSRELKR